MWKAWKTRTPCKTGVLEMRINKGWGRALHTVGGESTGVFRWAVGSVGKHGRVMCAGGRFSNCPELHSRVLENGGSAERCMDRGFGQGFHFSCGNYGYYGEYVLVVFKKEHSPSHAVAGIEEPRRRRRVHSWSFVVNLGEVGFVVSHPCCARIGHPVVVPGRVRERQMRAGWGLVRGIQRCGLVFHAAAGLQGDYNQKQETRGVSRAEVCVVE